MKVELSRPISDIPADLRGAISQWLELDKNPETREEVILLCNAQNWEELHKRFDKRIVFGTAGLRSRMEAGFDRMNSLVILQTSQGLAEYLKKVSPDNLTFVIGHDHRLHSKEFATVTTAIFLKLGFKVYSLNPGDALVHTPLVPFSVDKLGAAAGVMVTASHNPMMDNGYKVYYSNGCQIIPPHDHDIAKSIDEHLKPCVDEWDWDTIMNDGLKQGKLEYIKQSMTNQYLTALNDSLVDKTLVTKLSSFPRKPWFVYTPMHGVGYEIFETITSRLLGLEVGTDFLCVKEQLDPDPKFTTVRFPNPEEKGALDRAIQLAETNDIDLVIANDPDADRFSTAFKDPRTGVWKQISGDEIGYLFAQYEFEKYKKLPLSFRETHPLAMLNSTVSSQMIKKMAYVEGFHYVDTLTGFKWIGNRAIDLEKKGYFVPLGYEEAIGYMFPKMEHDKDGISASTVFLQAFASWVLESNKTPRMVLEDGYRKYGFFKQYNGYFKLPDLHIIGPIFDFIRKEYSPGEKYPHSIGGKLKILTFRDLTTGFQSDTTDNKPDLPVDPSSQMITITAKPEYGDAKDELIRCTMRGSGTEPKLKIYIEASAASESRANALTRLTWDTLEKEWFRPEKTGITTDF
ncbi:phosphoribomutase [Maudiozyma humilis]|uniref:phosphopentomutase n=1 Tax=Maudiozyma humilis TaxID=51915 RepID=A0AAV5S077_MAUHU|nr:phosphoribomutase [Kazachstania humilis]